VRPHLVRCRALVALLLQHLRLTQRDPQTERGWRVFGRWPPGQHLVGLVEDPRPADSPPRDHHPRTPRVLEDRLRHRGAEHIATGDDRNAQHLHKAPRAPMVGLAGEALGDGPGMHRDRRHADLLKARPQLQVALIAVVAPGADLARHRHPGRLHNGLRDGHCAVRVAHEGRPAPGLEDLRHGAAHVDVDDVRARAFQVGDGIGHGLGLGAEDLEGYRVLARVAGKQGEALGVVAGKALDRHHLRAHQVRPRTVTQYAQRQVREPCHRPEYQRSGKLNVANLQPSHVGVHSPKSSASRRRPSSSRSG